MKHKVTHCVYAEKLYQIVCVDHVSFGLTHFSVALKEPGMTKYLLRQRQIQSHQEDRPVDCMETNDVFSNEVKVCGPVFLEEVAALTVAVITDSGDVVGQGVKPYINHMLRIEVYRDSPFEGGSGYAEILQSRQKEVVHHLIFTGNGLDELRMLVDVVDESLGIFAHFEEVSFLTGRLYLAAAVRAFAVYQLGLGEERLTGSTVHSLVVALIDIAFGVHFFENFLNLFLMIIIGGADEFIIRSVHEIPDPFDLRRYVIDKLLRSNAGFLSLQLDLLAVLVGSGLEKYIVALLSLETGDAVCENDLVSVSDMRLA